MQPSTPSPPAESDPQPLASEADLQADLAPELPADLPPELLAALQAAPQPELPPDHRSGFIAVIGRPNAGKSTLLNRLLGQKIAITSPKPQTTRDQLLGILTTEDAQFLFLDTPGLHKPLHKLGEYMVAVAAETIDDADIVLWLVDITVPPTGEDSAIAELLLRLYAQRKLPLLVLGCNHADRWRGGAEETRTRVAEYTSLLAPLAGRNRRRDDRDLPLLSSAVFSAAGGEGVPALQSLLRELLPLGPRYYPEDQVTDLQMRFIAAELIREKALLLLQDEVPHSMAVEVDEFIERSPTLTYISAVIYLERESQKPIVLGKDGAMIKRIGQSARPEIEEMIGTKVYLELWVKVWERWRRRDNLLRQLGYAVERKKGAAGK